MIAHLNVHFAAVFFMYVQGPLLILSTHTEVHAQDGAASEESLAGING